MSQNIYDNPDFFAGYATLPRSAEGLDGALILRHCNYRRHKVM